MVLQKPVLASSQAIASSHRDRVQPQYQGRAEIPVGAGASLR